MMGCEGESDGIYCECDGDVCVRDGERVGVV